MKRIFYNTLSLLVGAAMLTSCLKDDRLVLDPEKSVGNVVEFGNTGTPTSPAGAPVFAYTPATLESVPSADFTASVRYAGAEDVAPQDITVQLSAAPEAVTTWNAAYPTASPAAKYNMLPAGTYSFPASVTILKGQKSASFKINVKPNMLNAAQSNVLGIKIASTSAGTISGNFGTVIYNLPVKSIWDGKYNFSATNTYGTIDANITGYPYPEPNVVLSTVAPNRLRVQYINQVYTGFVEYQFDGTNTAITEVKAYNGATIYATSIQSFSLNTTTKNFNISFTWAGRGVNETWVRVP